MENLKRKREAPRITTKGNTVTVLTRVEKNLHTTIRAISAD